MTAQDVLVSVVVLLAAAYVVRFLYRRMTAKDGCGCGEGRPCHGADATDRPPPTLKRTPLVRIQPPDDTSPASPMKR
ncbi:MAG: FeoB-associated Cys-rich membrane protein [Planctomycetota bacterium]|nr:MAG: FeoB-associated Cys-rich membrane protein [Planctomycetota bacterium]